MTQEEALDVDTRVTTSEAMAEIKAHSHNPIIRTFPTGEQIGGDCGYCSWIVVVDGHDVDRIARISKDGTVSSFEVMAWLGY